MKHIQCVYAMSYTTADVKTAVDILQAAVAAGMDVATMFGGWSGRECRTRRHRRGEKLRIPTLQRSPAPSSIWRSCGTVGPAAGAPC